ncbi:hypothetical protein P4388_33925 [Bacillus thuringiensis]|uniref:hypothetical protein n=1 Tax=Bacillus cereus group TaxID=86661 RepID=UPI000AF2DF33|nr:MULTISPECIES: hypothetical protein [Bacillus cereus group]MCU5278230.1 hypothetical protein [Bacillus cereus]MEB9589429.1 hypothetical protein [Bacillus cereus]MEB9608160.1 hypothetical protein [Bacillus cereus]MEB9692487.1 hypothetical protein [Bacillus cereus]MEB9710330.1 hypothetical protein [Bacillus cereus]
MNLRYAVVNEKGGLVSKLYIRKGDAMRELKRWNQFSTNHYVGTFELILKEASK